MWKSELFGMLRATAVCNCVARCGVAMMFVMFTAVSGQARPLDDVIESNLLRIVVYYDNRPFSWEEDGVAKGIDADIGRAIAAKLKVKPEILVRSAGEDVDDDLRSNIWQGPRTGGPKGDVMLHVPMEREFIARNNLVAISNAYYREEVVLALNTDLVPDGEGLSAFRKLDVACQFSTSAHYFLAFIDDGAYRDNVSPYIKFKDAVARFKSKESAGLMGRRAQIESYLKGSGLSLRYLMPDFPPTLRGRWNIGTAVKDDSRDLGYAIGAAFDEMKSSGELRKIFEAYGVSFVDPSTR